MSTPPVSFRTFDDDRSLLLGVFRDVVTRSHGPGALELHDRAVDLARAGRTGDPAADRELAELVGSLEIEDAEILVRTLTRWFQLINLAEDNERVRRMRRREQREAPAPRTGSARDAIERLRAGGVGPAALRELLDRAEIRLVLTAHPTEIRRRTTLEKLARVFGVLRDLDERPVLGEDRARERLAPTVQELWASDELRAVSPTVLDEVRTGLVWFVTTLAAKLPEVYRDLEAAIEGAFPGEDIAVPSLLTFGSWIGGDRDGNPYVTPSATGEALAVMRERCVRFLEERVEMLAGRVSLSERLTGPAEGLDDLLADGAGRFPRLAAHLDELNPEEPYRRAFTYVRERLRASAPLTADGYRTPADLLADLRTIETSLAHGAGDITARGDLRDVLRQVEVFGMHFARLDIREHAGRHRAALDEILSELGIHDGYGRLACADRCDLLCALVADHRPVVPADLSGFSSDTRTVVETFRAVRDLLDGEHAGAIEAYVVSGTEGPADLLEVLLLMKEAGLTRAGGRDAVLRIVPLFEAADTLRGAPGTMDALMRRAEYREALRAVGDEQEVMIGYSDSNKDAGYVASGWTTYSAQERIAAVLREHGASWVFFHGRGGALGRGGGPTNTAILALPGGTVGGRLKMTEQGEVLAAKYAVPEVAHRELELTLSATLVAALEPTAQSAERSAHAESVMERMAAVSERAYRDLVHGDPDFARFFSAVTPLDEVSRLQVGSRPARRRADGGIASLRAIPWVFSWTQSRIVLPAWFGLGIALADAREREGVEVLRGLERSWGFFGGLLANASMALAKADLRIARHYVAMWDEEEPRERIWEVLVEEYDRTREELLLVREESRLLDRSPVLQASIDRRNPYVDPLSFLQVELLRRRRATTPAPEPATPSPEDPLARVSLLTVNGIAGGLRNTG